MDRISDKEDILSFLKKNHLAVLSTVNKDGSLHAVPIYFIIEDNFDLFFVTPIRNQKNININYKNDVVLAITNEEKRETVQVRGKAEIDEKKPLREMLEKLSSKINTNAESELNTVLPLLKHKNQKKIVIKIKPYEIRLQRYTQEALEEKTIKFNEDVKRKLSNPGERAA